MSLADLITPSFNAIADGSVRVFFMYSSISCAPQCFSAFQPDYFSATVLLNWQIGMEFQLVKPLFYVSVLHYVTEKTAFLCESSQNGVLVNSPTVLI
ncbi:hypothetical protein SLA2020_411740 [Shorea laevis]